MPAIPSKAEKFLKKAHKNLAHSFFERIGHYDPEAAVERWRKGDASLKKDAKCALDIFNQIEIPHCPRFMVDRGKIYLFKRKHR